MIKLTVDQYLDLVPISKFKEYNNCELYRFDDKDITRTGLYQILYVYKTYNGKFEGKPEFCEVYNERNDD